MKTKGIDILELVRARISAEYTETMAEKDTCGMSLFDFYKYNNLKDYMLSVFANKRVAYILNQYKGNLLIHLFEIYKHFTKEECSIDIEDVIENAVSERGYCF